MKHASVESARYEPTVFDAVRRYRIMVLAFALASLGSAVAYTVYVGGTYRVQASVTVPGAARSKAASALLTAAKSSFDLVLIDSPPLLQVAGATKLVGASDATIIVLSPNELVRDHLEMVDRLKLIGSDVVGYIYNRAPMPPQPARYQRNGSSARLLDFRPTVLSTSSGGQPSNGNSGLSAEPEHG